jgi:hypothetical protein
MEDTVDDRTCVLLSALTGAAVGGLAGYLMFTDNGRRMRRQLEPALDDFIREVQRLGVTVNRARNVASEGWRVLNQAAGEPGGGWNAGVSQQTPF